MSKLTVGGVDYPKHVIQVSVLSSSKRELQNRALTRHKFVEFPGHQKRSLMAFQACTTAHHWALAAQPYSHEVKIVREGHYAVSPGSHDRGKQRIGGGRGGE